MNVLLWRLISSLRPAHCKEISKPSGHETKARRRRRSRPTDKFCFATTLLEVIKPSGRNAKVTSPPMAELQAQVPHPYYG